MNFLNLFCPAYSKHGRIWDIDEDTFYCSHHQHDEEGTPNIWTAQELIQAHATSAEESSQSSSGLSGVSTKKT